MKLNEFFENHPGIERHQYAVKIVRRIKGKGIVGVKGKPCVGVYIHEYFPKDLSKEMGREIVSVKEERREGFNVSLSGGGIPYHYEHYTIVLDELTRGNRGRHRLVSFDYEPLPEGAKYRFCL